MDRGILVTLAGSKLCSPVVSDGEPPSPGGFCLATWAISLG